jgi:S-adenosylmethionine:tRNA ribosyltransferase-isomerase
MLRPGRRLRAGAVIRCGRNLSATVLDAPAGDDGRREIRLQTLTGDVATVLREVALVPLPPYITRPPRDEDRERYQTIYAREPGSVAAPTAGLHFTRDLLAGLAARGIEIAELVLHVGPGTFRPVKVADVRDHRVAPEPYDVPVETAAAIERTRRAGGRVVAVGTTVVRTLETAWVDGRVRDGSGETSLVITPGHVFQSVDALITNFHLPRSSLLLLVAAFAGRETILAAYREAIVRGYRFYSYGDAMFITGRADRDLRP